MSKAIKLALEALELMYACYAHPEWISHKQQEEKILAQCVATTMTLRQTLANQEQGEPVALAEYDAGLLNDYGGGRVYWWWEYIRYELGLAHDHYQDQIDNLYTKPQPRTWVGLTDEQIDGLHNKIKVQLMGTFNIKDIYRAIEAELRSNNK